MSVKSYARLTASGLAFTGKGRMSGFYVSSTNAGTLVLYDNTSAGALQITGTITPSVGFNPLPVDFNTGLYAAIGGTALDVTLLFDY